MERAYALLKQTFGYDEFRHSQAEVIERLIQGGDAFVLMPTGGGKSLCYQIPALVRSGVGVVVSPLIALMQDQVNALAQLGIRAAFINSSLTYDGRQQVEQALLRGDLDLLYVAPERLLTPAMIALLERIDIALFAIDEAHCVSQWGHDFRKDYQQLRMLHQRFPQVPRIALTATADGRTRHEIIEQLALHQAGVYVNSFDRPNIRYQISDQGDAREQLWRFIQYDHPHDAGIVYCLSRKRVEQVADWLSRKGRIALPYHAGLPNEMRRQHQARFLRDEGVIVVATIAFGMGIDKPDVRFVAHLNLPKNIEAYYQETGRAGRDGEPATAWMSYGLQDVIQLRQMLMEGDAAEQFKRVATHKLEAMLGLCEMTGCRRQALLGYFDELLAKPCGNCDNCLTPPQTWDATVPAQMALSCIYRTGQRFGVSYLVNVLLGKADDRIRANGHDRVSTFAIGGDYSQEQWRTLYRQLIALGYIRIDPEGFGGLQLTDKCGQLFKGEQALALRKSVRQPISRREKREKTSKGQARVVDEVLFEALRALRTSLAHEQGIAPFMIFHDTTLHDLARHRPADLDAMRMIQGVGQAKLDRYGVRVLAVIHEHPLPDLLNNRLSDTINETLGLYLDGLNGEAIAQKRGLKLSTIYVHFAEAIEAGLLSSSDVLNAEEVDYDCIVAAAEQLSICDEGRLKPLYDHFEGQYEYGQLRCVLAELCG